MMKNIRLFVVLAVIAVVASCVTVNIYFPAAAVQDAADKLVEDIRGLNENGESAPAAPPVDDKQSGLSIKKVLALLGPSEAHAAVDVNVSTPAIRALMNSMSTRFAALKPFYDNGAIGETSQGTLEVRDTGALGLKDKSTLNRLVGEENSDRNSLYEEIMRANGYGPETLPEIRRIFANSWRDKAMPGWWVQSDGGQWAKK